MSSKTVNNSLMLENDVQISTNMMKNVDLNVVGKNNTIIIKNDLTSGRISINLFGDNNLIYIDDNFYVSSNLYILIGQNHENFGKVHNSVFRIGKNTSMEQVSYITYNSNTHCNIGDYCLFSYGITLYNTDAHPIFKKNTKEIINKIDGIDIGNHCWIGMQATIMKNSFIPNDSIIGCNTVFATKKFTETNCVYAGNPARLIKRDVDWDTCGAKYGYIEN